MLRIVGQSTIPWQDFLKKERTSPLWGKNAQDLIKESDRLTRIEYVLRRLNLREYSILFFRTRRSLNESVHVISRPFAGLSTLLRLSATTHPRGKMSILPEAVIICKLCQTFVSYDMCGLRTREFSIECFFHLPSYLLTMASGLNAFTFSVGPAPPDLFRFPLSVLAFRRLLLQDEPGSSSTGIHIPWKNSYCPLYVYMPHNL